MKEYNVCFSTLATPNRRHRSSTCISEQNSPQDLVDNEIKECLSCLLSLFHLNLYQAFDICSYIICYSKSKVPFFLSVCLSVFPFLHNSKTLTYIDAQYFFLNRIQILCWEEFYMEIIGFCVGKSFIYSIVAKL